MVTPWNAAIFQLPFFSLASSTDRADATRMKLARLDEHDAMIGRAVGDRSIDMVVLPEFTVGNAEDDLRGVSDGKGIEMDRMAAIAASHGVLLAANLYLDDERFPGRYFNTSVLFGENGELLARYYRLITNHSTSPHDFWQRYLDVVGLEGAFPVARTRLGNFAMLSSLELMYPELARIYTLRGAEILLHLSQDQKVDLAVKQTRATENMAYLLSANTAPNPPGPRRNVASAAIDWLGYSIAQAPLSGPGECHATIDIDALRTARSTPLHDDYVNYLSRLRAEVMRGHYDGLSIYPMDSHVEGSAVTKKLMPERDVAGFEAGVANLVALGIAQPPG